MKTKRILIFNVNWLGDVLFSTAAIRNIRRNFPDSFIACIVPSRCYQILKANPYLDEIIIFDEKDRHKGLFSKLKFITFLKNKRFNIVYLFHRSFTRALISYLAKIPERVGFYTRKRGWILTKKIPKPEKDSLHRIDYYLNLIEKAGLRVEDRFTDFFITEKDERFIENFLKEENISPQDFTVVISPAGNWPPKRWPHYYFAHLLDRLITELKAKVIITAHIKDRAIIEKILNNMKERPINACGKFNLKQLAALLKRVNLFISSDTGPLHIANSVGTKKIIALFGPTSSKITAPFPLKNVLILQKDVGCKIPCYVVGCQDNRCMKAITPEEVFEKIKTP